ncbi:MAG: hypothetical protein WC648_00865 [Candidatus Paceibacterota bacterium]|jgi:hypothetical protein
MKKVVVSVVWKSGSFIEFNMQKKNRPDRNLDGVTESFERVGTDPES